MHVRSNTFSLKQAFLAQHAPLPFLFGCRLQVIQLSPWDLLNMQTSQALIGGLAGDVPSSGARQVQSLDRRKHTCEPETRANP